MDEFDRSWRQKFYEHVKAAAGEVDLEEIRPRVDNDDSFDEEREAIAWTRAAMLHLEDAFDARTCHEIMTGCACHYPSDQLETLQSIYQHTGDIKQVHAALQAQFEDFLRETLKLDGEAIADVTGRGWGAAGLLEGDRITATKIPKSGDLKRYLAETDAEVRRSYYCHCPRVRHAVGTGELLPITYCYCGAGFYKHMWETILQDEVSVEILESVLSGGDVCKVVIELPCKG